MNITDSLSPLFVSFSRQIVRELDLVLEERDACSQLLLEYPRLQRSMHIFSLHVNG